MTSSGFLATIILYNLREQPVSYSTSVPNEGINQQCAHYSLFMNYYLLNRLYLKEITSVYGYLLDSDLYCPHIVLN